MANMTDRNRVSAIMNAMLMAGGSAPVWGTTHSLLLMSAQGSNTVNGTQCGTASFPGYLTGGTAITFGANAGGTSASSTTASWVATGSWGTVTSVEVWDNNGTPQRWLQGPLVANIVGVSNGDTVQFAVGAVTADASQW